MAQIIQLFGTKRPVKVEPETLVKVPLRDTTMEKCEELVGRLGQNRRQVIENAIEAMHFLKRFRKILVENDDGEIREVKWDAPPTDGN